MNYAKVENGQVVQVGLPTTGILTQAGFEGCTTSSYNLLPYISDNPEIPSLKNEGWLPLTENRPTYDNTTQYLEFVDYTVGDTEVIVNYTVKPKPAPEPPQPTMEEYLIDLDYRVSMIELGL